MVHVLRHVTIFFHAYTKHGSLGVPCLWTIIPALQPKRFARLAKSDNPVLQAVVMRPWSCLLLEQTKTLVSFRKEMIKTPRQSRVYWKRRLHSSANGKAPREVTNAPACSKGVQEGTRLLSGRAFIDVVKQRISALPNLTRTKMR